MLLRIARRSSCSLVAGLLCVGSLRGSRELWLPFGLDLLQGVEDAVHLALQPVHALLQATYRPGRRGLGVAVDKFLERFLYPVDLVLDENDEPRYPGDVGTGGDLKVV